MRDTAAGRGGNLRPIINAFVSGLLKNRGVLADEDFLGKIDGVGETEDGVNEGRGVEFLAVLA